MKTSEILIKARDLIADPARWTQGTAARDANQEITEPESEGAVCWCSMGAVMKVEGFANYIRRERAYDELCDAADALDSASAGLSDYNDTHTHAEVMTMFDTAIATAQARGD